MYPTVIDWPIEVSSFGVMVALGFFVGGWMAARAFEDAGLSGEAAWNTLTWCVIGGLLGSKLWFVGEALARGADPSNVLELFGRGGLTWYGGFVGGTILGVIGAKRNGVTPLQALNLASPTLAVGQAIGRIGCFLVGDDYGRASDVPWAVAFPQGLPPTTEPVHPTMLYEMLWLLPVGAWLWSRRGQSPFLFGEYLVLSGLGRLWIEGLRVNPALIGPLSNAQVFALVCIVAGAIGLVVMRSRSEAPAS